MPTHSTVTSKQASKRRAGIGNDLESVQYVDQPGLGKPSPAAMALQGALQAGNVNNLFSMIADENLSPE